MNPFDKINELKLALKQEASTKGVQPTDTISWLEHYQRMLNMLAVIEHELKDADYNYVVSSLDGRKIKTFDKVTIKQEQLTDGLLVFTPLAVDDGELSTIDMNSLYNILVELRNSGKIKEDVMVLPPYVAVFKAKLAKGETDYEEDEDRSLEDDWDAVEEEHARKVTMEEQEIANAQSPWGDEDDWEEPN